MRPFNEDALRRVLETEAAAVEVQPDALPAIRRRIAARRARWSPRGGFMITFGSAAAVAAATAVAIFAGVGSCAPQRDPAPPPVAGPSPTRTAAPEPTDPPGPTSTAPEPGATANLPVYFLGLDRDRPRLYREYHPVPVADSSAAAKVRAAVGFMLAGRAADPDYTGGWPAGARLRDARVEGGVVVVDVSGAARHSVGAELAEQAVQQLVWTASAQAPGNPPVRILLDGQRVDDLWGHVDIGSDLRRGAAAAVLAQIWVIDPQHGATVGRTFELKIAGIVFEATAQVRIKRAGAVVHERFVTLDQGPPSQGVFAYRVTLPAGSYTVEGYAISAADGSEQHLDDHDFTVR